VSPFEPFRSQVERKWDVRHREAARVQRAIAIAIAAAVVIGSVVVGILGRRLTTAGGISYCCGNLRQLARGLSSYAADYDECLPPENADVAALMMTYVSADYRRCPLLRPGERFSYAMAPGVGGVSLGTITQPPEEVICLIETGFRHYHEGQWWMATTYLDRTGGAATPEMLRAALQAQGHRPLHGGRRLPPH